MAKQLTEIEVEGKIIRISQVEEKDYISLTDMVRGSKRPADVIRNWLRNKSTLHFLAEWEILYNPDFKVIEFEHFSNQAGLPTFVMTAKEWTQQTNAIGIRAKAGRGGGTYAHRDIAFEFGSHISPRFKLLLIREFQRLKSEEAKKLYGNWSFSRFLSKVNYTIHTEAIKENLLPRIDPAKRETYVFASEADLLNVAVFGMNAREWREAYPESAKKGNMRDFASLEELTVLSNLESLNAYLIERGASQIARFEALAATAQTQLIILRDHELLPGED